MELGSVLIKDFILDKLTAERHFHDDVNSVEMNADIKLSNPNPDHDEINAIYGLKLTVIAYNKEVKGIDDQELLNESKIANFEVAIQTATLIKTEEISEENKSLDQAVFAACFPFMRQIVIESMQRMQLEHKFIPHYFSFDD